MDKETIYKVNMIALLEDLQHQYMIELKPNVRHGLKAMLNNCINHTTRFIKECDKIFNSEDVEDFGITSDLIREMLDEKFLK